jgi:acetyl-CoA C-acetyltransferase
MKKRANTPIIIGAGQATAHWDGKDKEQAPSPVGMAARAGRAALEDTRVMDKLSKAIDSIAIVRANHDSVPHVSHPFGRCANPPATLAAQLGLQAQRLIYSVVGGDQPQALVNEMAEAVFRGDCQAALIAGGEAIATAKLAQRQRIKLDWSATASGDLEDRALGSRLLSDDEIKNGLGMPVQTYPLFEHAWRTRHAMSRADYVDAISQLWSRFSAVAAANPFAQFPVARSAEFLSTPSKDNYRVADPYLKWHVAQDAVNQGAAVVVTSVENATQFGVPESNWIYLHGYAQVSDKLLSQRPDLSRSLAMRLALERALQVAGKRISDLSFLDLYSCFPSAVLIASEILGVDWRTSTPTVTGGLPFFGGPGNNYSMHAIARMVELLREKPGQYGLILANGGFLSKEAVGIYSTASKDSWAPIDCGDLAAEIDRQQAPDFEIDPANATVETYSVTYKRDRPDRACVVARTATGRRVVARARSGHLATIAALVRTDPIGKTIKLQRDGDAHFFCPSDGLGTETSDQFMSRTFEHILVQRVGHVLEVTINRPEKMNALHGPAHFELHEVWDTFQADQDLWVAIVTGAGERAFSAGNDLKATAQGADTSTPRSGFAGICSRFDRTKPVIAAVNGVAMGGGLEIVLACDLAVADETAKFALPEVRVGLFAAAGGVQRLSRQIGRKAAMELILTGRHLEASEAHTLGIVNSVSPKGQSLAGARALAAAIMRNSPSAIQASKEALNELDEIDELPRAMQGNTPIFDRMMRKRDFMEGVTAFAEKREPRWTNT